TMQLLTTFRSIHIYSFYLESSDSFFIFSSRRRHTRCLSDWSSDVCSSDLFLRAEAHDETSDDRRDENPAAGCGKPIESEDGFFRPGWFLRRWRRNHRSEEHTSELQSLRHLVCRLLLEKKKRKQHNEQWYQS